MKKRIILFLVVTLIVVACKESSGPFIQNKLNKAWLQKIISNSDSTYQKPYYRSDFVTASYYIDKKDSSLCQVMRDSSNGVRQIIIEKGGIRTFYAQYYPNGQAIAILSLDEQGKFSGKAELFYPNGKTESKGRYYSGFRIGEWELYNEKGIFIKKEEYDSSGQLLRTISSQ